MTSIKNSDNNNNIVIRNYLFLENLGEGQFGKVFKVQNQITNKIYAAKVINKEILIQQPFLINYIENEIISMENIDNPFVIKLQEYFENPQAYFIIMECCNQGNLQQYIEKSANNCLSEEETIKILAQILQGLKALHENKIIHRDLKPENILINDGIPKIADFGFSKQVHENSLSNTNCGTDMFMAPEVHKGDDYGFAVDIWSLGVIVFNMLFGQPPFQEKLNFIQHLNQMCIPCFTFEKSFAIFQQLKNRNKVSKEMENLISRILTIDPEQRATFDQLFEDPIFLRYKNDQCMLSFFNCNMKCSNFYRNNSHIKISTNSGKQKSNIENPQRNNQEKIKIFSANKNDNNYKQQLLKIDQDEEEAKQRVIATQQNKDHLNYLNSIPEASETDITVTQHDLNRKGFEQLNLSQINEGLHSASIVINQQQGRLSANTNNLIRVTQKQFFEQNEAYDREREHIGFLKISNLLISTIWTVKEDLAKLNFFIAKAAWIQSKTLLTHLQNHNNYLNLLSFSEFSTSEDYQNLILNVKQDIFNYESDMKGFLPAVQLIKNQLKQNENDDFADSINTNYQPFDQFKKPYRIVLTDIMNQAVSKAKEVYPKDKQMGLTVYRFGLRLLFCAMINKVFKQQYSQFLNVYYKSSNTNKLDITHFNQWLCTAGKLDIYQQYEDLFSNFQ